LSVPDHPEIFVVGDMGEVAFDGKVLRSSDRWRCSRENMLGDR
jgi:hypothetical protein